MMQMRTKLTIEDDIMRRLRQKAAADDLPLRDVVNEVLRCGLAGPGPESSAYTFRLTTRARAPAPRHRPL